MGEKEPKNDLPFLIKIFLGAVAIVISMFKLVVVSPCRKAKSTISKLWKFTLRKYNSIKLWLMGFIGKITDAKVQEHSNTQMDSGFISLHQEIYALKQRNEELEREVIEEL